MAAKIKIGISSCLLGENVRYDGRHKHDKYLTDTLGEFVEWVPVCPEVECGLSVPREAMMLMGDPDGPRLITISSGIDHTDRMKEWASIRLKELEADDICGFIFKGRSPSSGYRGVKVYSSSGMPARNGTGIFAGMFIRHFPLIPVEDDERLHDPALREAFIERVFAFRRRKNLPENSSPTNG